MRLHPLLPKTNPAKIAVLTCAGYFGHPFHPDMYTLTHFGVTIYHIHVPLVRK